MRPCIKNAMWLGTLLAVMTVSLATVAAQNEDKDKSPAKPGGQAGALQGGMGQMMGGQAGMT
jgi:hypothetical protein